MTGLSENALALARELVGNQTFSDDQIEAVAWVAQTAADGEVREIEEQLSDVKFPKGYNEP